MKNKDYIKINRAIDLKYLKDLALSQERLKEEGVYPDKLTYPLTLQFELTGQCNLACKHCYNRSGDNDRKTLMTPNKWCDLAHQIVNDGGIFQCIISGGEPLLLGDRLFDIMDILHNDGTSFVVITNGYLLTPEKVEKFKKYRFFWFQISIDGYCSEIHDSFRGVSGSWERAVRGAIEITNNGIPLTIAHSVIPSNLKYLDKMVSLAYELGASSIILGETLPSGRAIENNNLFLTKEERNYLYEKINSLQDLYQDKIIIKRSANLKIQMERYRLETNAGGIIRPNGDFRLDCMTPFVIGNVLEKSVKEIWLSKGINAWKSKKVSEFIESINEDEQMGYIKNHLDKDIIL